MSSCFSHQMHTHHCCKRNGLWERDSESKSERERNRLLEYLLTLHCKQQFFIGPPRVDSVWWLWDKKENYSPPRSQAHRKSVKRKDGTQQQRHMENEEEREWGGCKEYNITVLFEVACIHFCSSCKAWCSPTSTPYLPPTNMQRLVKAHPTPTYMQRLVKEVRRQCSPLEVWSHPLHCPLCVFVNWEAACYSAPAI